MSWNGPKNTTYLRPSIDEEPGSIYVGMNQFTIAKFREHNEIKALATRGAGPCLILTIYSPKYRVGLVAHITPGFTDLDASLSYMASTFNSYGGELFIRDEPRATPSNLVDIWLIGGTWASRKEIGELKSLLRKFNYRRMQENTVYSDDAPEERALLELKTGKVYRQSDHLTRSVLEQQYGNKSAREITDGFNEKVRSIHPKNTLVIQFVPPSLFRHMRQIRTP